MVTGMVHTEHHRNRRKHAELHPTGIKFRIIRRILFETAHAMRPIAHTAHADIQSGTYDRLKPLPFAAPVACPDIGVTLNAGIALTGMSQASHIIIFLEFAIRRFGIRQRINIMKFFQIHRSAYIGLHKLGSDGSNLHHTVVPPPVYRFRFKEVHQAFIPGSRIEHIPLFPSLVQ